MFDIKNPLSRNLHDEGAVKFANRMICFDEKETAANDSGKADGAGSKTASEGDIRATEVFDKHQQDNAVTGNVVPDSGKDPWQIAEEQKAARIADEAAKKEAAKNPPPDNTDNTTPPTDNNTDDKTDDKKTTDKDSHLPDDPEKLKKMVQDLRKEKSQGNISLSDDDIELFGGADEAERIADVLKAGNLSQKQADAVLGELKGWYSEAASDSINNENGSFAEQRKILNEAWGLQADKNIDQATRFAERMAGDNKELQQTAKAIMNSAAGAQFIHNMMSELSNTVPNIAVLGAPTAPSNIFSSYDKMVKAIIESKDKNLYNTDTELHKKIADSQAYWEKTGQQGR